MRTLSRYRGVIISSLGASMAAFFGLKPLMTISTDHSWEDLTLVLFLSVLVGGLVNAVTVLDLRQLESTRGAFRKSHEELVSPLLRGMEDTLSRRVPSLMRALQEQSKGVHPLKFYVFSKHHSAYRILAATVDRAAMVRRVALSDTEGIVGFTYGIGGVVWADVEKGKGTMYDRGGERLGDHTPLQPENLSKCDVDVRWVYALPVFESSQILASTQVIGVLTVDSSSETSRKLFSEADFRQEVESIAFDVARYLTAFHKLCGITAG